MKIAQIIALSAASVIASVSFAATTTQPTVPASKTTTAVKTTPATTVATKAQTTTINKSVSKATKTVPTSKTTVVTKKVTTSGFKCKDGSISKAKSTRGACSGHGGIAK